MYTKYETQFHMATHLKRANCILIHDSMLDMAVSLASQVNGANLDAETRNGKVLHILRYKAPQKPSIGFALVDWAGTGNFAGKEYPVYEIKENHIMVDTGYGVTGVKKTRCQFFSLIESAVA